jgi:hypothetical protein
MLPAMVAGPLTTAYVTTPVDSEVALTANGALPYVWAGIAANVRVGTVAPAAGATTKLALAVADACSRRRLG